MEKPIKPYPEFPLWPNPNGQWCKKIRGRIRYFGVWRDPESALAKYLAEVDHWQAGQTPPAKLTTVANLLDAFLGDKAAHLAEGSISKVSYDEYQRTCDTINDTLGYRPLESLTPDDFRRLREVMGQSIGVVTLKRRLTIARMVFAMAAEWGYTLQYRTALKAPSKLVIRQAERERGEQLYSAADVRKLVKTATGDMRAVVLLGINCGFGAKDCATFPGPEGEWHNYWRPKTQADRRCWLWPETREALPIHGKWDRYSISREFNAIADSCGVENYGHYSLRRTLETVADAAGVSQATIDHIMGHLRDDMASIYRQRIFDKQIKKCAEFVREWYLGTVTLE